MFKKYLCLCFFLGIPLANANINCVAKYRYIDGDGNLQKQNSKLVETSNAGNVQTFDVQRKEADYTVQINTQDVLKHKPDVILDISFPPQYLKGTTSEFSSQKGSNYTLSYVNGDKVFNIECQNRKQ